MSDGIVIKLDRVSKIYRIYRSNRQRFAHELLGIDKGVPFVALNNINIEIKKGDNVAILGDFGSGRSTLAKIMAGISHPTAGNVTINGSVMPVFDLRSGFDLNFTGYDNINIKGCLMGWTKQKIKERQQDIIELAEMEKSIGLKMSAYKPVDRSRLGLSMVCMDDSDIIVFDCAIMVGNPAQRAKCIEKIKEWTDSKERTFVMVGGVGPVTKKLCDRGVVLCNGELKYDGPLKEAVKEYKEKYRAEGVKEKKESIDDTGNDYENDDGTDFCDF